jgi:hypothetical protein
VRVDKHTTSGREVGQAGGDIHRVPHDPEPSLFVGRSHHDLTRIHTRMDLGEGHRWPTGVHAPNVIAKRDRSAYGSLRIVLVGYRNAEHGHETVAHHLRDGPSELLDRALQFRHRRAEEGVDLFRIERRR